MIPTTQATERKSNTTKESHKNGQKSPAMTEINEDRNITRKDTKTTGVDSVAHQTGIDNTYVQQKQ